jgi:hypothetical protein
VAVGSHALNLHQLNETITTAVAAAATTFCITPAQAQICGYSNGWRQPIGNGPVIGPTRSNVI